MRYSPLPHVAYVIGGTGPGAQFLGDVERWNWRWTFKGSTPDQHYDTGLVSFFNQTQRAVMQLPPAQALRYIEKALPNFMDAGVVSRLNEAQARLDAPRVKAEGNVVHVQF